MKLSSQSLKDGGIISADIRACVRDIVAIGAPLEGVGKIIQAVAKALNVQINDTISTRSAGRIVIEGGVAAQLQIVDDTEHFTGSGDGTSHKHLNYESRFIAVDQKLLALGLCARPSNPQDPRTFFQKVVGLMTDHANDQMKLRALFLARKERVDREIRGERALLQRSTPKLLDAIYQLTADKIEAAGGIAAWDALPADEQERINSTLHGELCQKYGQEEFDKLSEEEKAEADFSLGGGCCMHKDLNAHKVKQIMASWAKNGFQQPVLLMNKDNQAAANSGSAAAKARAEKVSSRGGVKLCELMGILLNNKDDKKGMQDSLGVYFQAREHIGYTIRFPDTSNTRYQCFSEAAAEIVFNLTIYRELMEFIRDRNLSLAFTNLESNIWKGLHDRPTLIELIVLLWYGQCFSHPVMQLVRSSAGGLQNLWDMGPAIRAVIAHCRRVIQDPDIICGDSLSYETASMDGQPWERPEAMYAAHALLPKLPMKEVQATLVEFLEGALETWERFGQSDVLKMNLTDVQKFMAWMPSTNDAIEGWLGANTRVAKRKAPNATLDYINSRSQYKHNGTGDFIAQKFDTVQGQQFLRRAAQAIGAEGCEKKRKVAQAEHDTRTVNEHRAKKKKADAKKAAEIEAINKCQPIFNIERFTDAAALKDISGADLTLQCKWHRLRELETDKKTQVPALSSLNKSQKAEVIVAALGRWLPQVESGEVPRLGRQVLEPLEPKEDVVEPEEEE
ncbi:hypothetical protein FB451DRAFT_1020393 [Mycena latifolia]|nr:hypothetical protein FB451DRAFT_1020393 [Mycena latifolia]